MAVCSQCFDGELIGSQLWLAVSADRRVSVWSADWSRDSCELVDWLTFPAPAFTPDGLVAKSTDSVRATDDDDDDDDGDNNNNNNNNNNNFFQ